MALTDEVITRYSVQRLVELTNPDDRAATTSLTARLNAASADAQAEFQIRAGVAYNNTLATHVVVGVRGVLYYLHLYSGVQSDELARAEMAWQEALDALSLTTGRNRIKPKTSSVLQPTAEQVSTETVRPDTDRPHFDGVVPNAPAVSFSPSREGNRGNR